MRGGFGRRMTGGEETDFDLSKLDRRAFGLVWSHVRKHLRTLFIALLSMIMVTLMGLAGPYLAMVAIDEYIAEGDISGLSVISALMLLSYGVFWLSSYWQRYLSNWAAQRVIGDLRAQLYDHIQGMSMEFFNKRRTGDLVSRVANDMDTISELVTSGGVNLLNDLLTLVGIGVIMMVLDVRLALVSFLLLPPIGIVMNFLGKKMRKAYTEVREKLAELNVDVEESIAGMRVVQALNREDKEMGTFSKLSWSNLRANLKAVSLFALLFPTMTISRVAGEALILGYGGWRVLQGGLTLGVVIAFLGYVRRFFAPLAEISQIYNTLQLAGASLNRAVEILDVQPTVQEAENPVNLDKKFRGKIVFDNVSFAYKKNEPVMEKFSLRIEPGEKFALVGPTGAGKTTVIRLATRLYDPDESSVYIDDIDLKKIRIEDLRSKIAVVPQTVFLFDTTVKENIRFGRPGARDSEVQKVAEMIGAHHFINRLPDGYETRVGENGVMLSGGQRQLVSFARALLCEPEVLILDEATSSVDPHSELLIKDAMPKILSDKTAIMIAHRLSTLERADRIGIMKNGQLTEIGSHEELMKKSSYYRELLQKQSSA